MANSAISAVENGLLAGTDKKIDPATGQQELGKDAFLQLLATQMRYQDPLNPNTDTQFVAQLATFSQLEQMQNLNTTNTNSQALGLVGKTVIVTKTDSSGNLEHISGKVTFATLNNGKAYLYINGEYYLASDLDTVFDDAFIDSIGLPYIPKKTELEYNKLSPEDLTFKVDMGSDEHVAKKVSIKIGEKVLDEKYVSVENGVVTISKNALKELDLTVGEHKVEVTFDDKNKTKISDKVTISVKEVNNMGLPYIPAKTELKYNNLNPEDLTFSVNMGNDDSAAKKVSIKIGEKDLDEKYVSVKNNIVTISKDILKELGLTVGEHKVEVIFDDKSTTKISDMITIAVEEKNTSK